ncbi:MAG: hypothetical protein EPO20_14860 [Betaproteobacteria bacterium]|nr:MAG: hypothetical protein EPO20_14860 [Betaproteobacteria bacterium]
MAAVALMIAGSLIKARADEKANKRKQAFADAIRQYQVGKTGEMQRATERLLEKQTPDARAAELAQLTAERAKSMDTGVGAAQAFDAPPIAAKASSDYSAANEAAANRIAERTRRAIEQLAVMSAPGQQQLRHGLRFGAASGDVDAANAAIGNAARAGQTDISAVRANPWAHLAGDVMVGGGQGMLISGAGKPAAPTPTPIPGDPEWGMLPPQQPGWRDRLRSAFGIWGR